MTDDIRINEARMPTLAHCKCGRAMSPADLRSFENRIEIVCPACHGSILELECELPEPWDDDDDD